MTVQDLLDAASPQDAPEALAGEKGHTAAIAAIETVDLAKTFGRRKQARQAVENLSLAVRQGEIFGLLGPNGSGKTTTINLLCGLLSPTSGTIRVLGRSFPGNRRWIRQRLGVISQETALYEELSAWENMSFHADLYGVPRKEKATKITRLLELVSLLERKDNRVGSFSGGMKRRLAIARALLHDPQLLFLDEPTLGVDVQSRASLWKHIKELRDAGKTILLTTNYLEEAQFLCDRLAIIDHGKLLVVDTPDNLRRQYGGSRIVAHVQRKGAIDLEGLSALPGVKEVDIAGLTITILTQGLENHLAEVIAILSQQNEVSSVTCQETNLDEVFLQLTGTALRD